ncbi:methyltransferase [Paenibacillus sp. y28]|uniref:methyltransferase n=1 Tax=Paenibacillus sp. y28 TaxID=3129110 RepID=UPI003016159B
MKQILIEVFVPALGRAFDVYIPFACSMCKIEPLLVHVIADLTDGQFVPSRDTVLCDRVTGAMLDIDMSALELGLHHGSRLMLI